MFILISMKVLQLMELINKGKNLIFYDHDVKPCYDKLKDKFLCVYLDEPTPARIRLIEIGYKVNKSSKVNIKAFSIPELKKLIISEVGDDKLIIIFNHFERLNNLSLRPYYDLNEQENIQFICNFKENFKKQIYPFFKKFELVNKSKYKKENNRDEINVTYAVYVLISVYCFLLYMKISYSVYTAFILVGGIWFALIIFRTLVYLGGRV